MNTVVKNQKIGIGEKTAFAVGEVYGGGAVALLSSLYFTFLTLMLKVDPAIAGAILMLARFWDAITDPLMGAISDNTRSRIGRRRPYIIASAPLIIVALLLLFLPIQGWRSAGLKIAYVVFAYLLYGTISTVFNVPYLSMTSEISENVKERSRMNMGRLIVSMLASAFCFLAASELVGKQRDGVISTTQFCLLVALGFGLFFALPVLCAGLFTHERSPIPKEKVKFSFRNFTDTFKLKAFRRLLGMYVFAFVCNEIIANLLIIFVFNVSHGLKVEALGGMQLATLVNFALLGSAGLILPLVLVLLNKGVPKPVIFMTGLPLFLVGIVAFAFFPAGANPVLIAACASVAGLGFGMAQVIPWLTFPDVIDVAELKYNSRNPGAFNGTMTFFKKFASGLAVFLIGVVLKGAGFDSELGTAGFQPASAVFGMRLVLGIVIPVCLATAFVMAFRIGITTRKSERVRHFIDRQRDGSLGGIAGEEKAEFEKLARELF